MLPGNFFSPIGLAILACAFAGSSARAEGLCENEGWQCAAVQATVGHHTVTSIHDPTHRDDRIGDGGIADISVKVNQMLSLVWQGQGDQENATKPRAHVKIISNKPAPIGCEEPEWMEESLTGDADIVFPGCHEGRNFVLTFRIDQGKNEEKTARIRVHVVGKDTNTEGADSSSLATTNAAPNGPQLKPDEEADFEKLQVY
jgi:hypothetical protein